MKRILVVDDNEDTREILRALMTYRGLEMVPAETGEEMLERIAEVDPDLVVLDVRLPGIDGCEALEQLREQGFRKPVFLFSEYYDLFLHRIKSCMPDGFYPKSRGPVLLLDAIMQTLYPTSSPT